MPSGWFRGKRVVLSMGLLLLGVHALTGFVAIPLLLQSRLLPLLSSKLGGTLQAADAAFNPFTLNLELGAFSLRDPEGHELIAADALSADLDALASLRRQALVGNVTVRNPKAVIELDGSGRSNFAFLQSGGATSGSTATPFHLEHLVVENGRMRFVHRLASGVFMTELLAVSISVDGLGNAQGAPATFTMHAGQDERQQMEVRGTLGLLPLTLEVDVGLSNFPLSALAPYASALEPYQVSGGELSMTGHGRWSPEKGGSGLEFSAVSVAVDRLAIAKGRDETFLTVGSLALQGTSTSDMARLTSTELTLRDIRIGPQAAPRSDEAGNIESIEIAGAALNLAEKSIVLERVVSQSANLSAGLTPDGVLHLSGGAVPVPSRGAATDSASAPNWHLRIGSVELRDYGLHFTDQSVEPPVDLKMTPISLTLQDIRSAEDAEFKLKLGARVGNRGNVVVEGKVVLRPDVVADLRIDVDDLGVRRFQPYLAKFAAISVYKGRLDLSGDFDFFAGPVDSVRFSGDAALKGLAATENRSGKELFNWQDLKLHGIIFETIPRRLSIREAIATEPYVNFIVDREGNLNVAQAFTSPASTPDARSGGKKPPPLPVVLGALHITKGHANFADLSLKPANFTIGVHELQGSVRGLSSQKGAKADILLQGKIGHDSPARVSGQFNPFSLDTFTDIAMHFRGVDLTTLSPYSGKFAGYRIEKGKVSMDLHYKLDEGRLVADNRFTFDHLTLGERVESADATSLPVELAVALLKDGNGRFDLDLPISGDLKNPHVSIGGLLAAAAEQFVAKLVSAPFSLLGNIVAEDGEDLGAVHFAAGSSQISPAEKEKLLKISRALKERPELNLEIKGEVNPVQDKPALAAQELARQLEDERRLARRRQAVTTGRPPDPAADDGRLLLEYVRRHAPHTLPAADAAAAFPHNGSVDDTRRRLLASWPVDELALRRLGQSRGQAVRDYFINEAGMPEQRIYLLDIRFAPPGETRIKADLALSGS